MSVGSLSDIKNEVCIFSLIFLSQALQIDLLSMLFSSNVVLGQESYGDSDRYLMPPGDVPNELAQPLSLEEQIAINVYDKCHKSVVHIETKGDSSSLVGRVVLTEGSGSGSVWDRTGHILTNYHVVHNASVLLVTLYDGKQFEAEIIGTDVSNDIAILKVNATENDLNPVSLGRSDRIKVGQRVFALGSPLGLEQTMTAGIVSSLNRKIPSLSKRTMRSIIQIDAALNRGNSGGPLLDTRGELVGMNTAIASRVGENSGIGFAIPSATIQRVVSQLLMYGKVRRPSLGIESIAETPKGLLVVSLDNGGPAEKAGVRGVKRHRYNLVLGDLVRSDYSTADIITQANGQDVKTVDDLLAIVESCRAGEYVKLSIVREGLQKIISILLVEERSSEANGKD